MNLYPGWGLSFAIATFLSWRIRRVGSFRITNAFSFKHIVSYNEHLLPLVSLAAATVLSAVALVDDTKYDKSD